MFACLGGETLIFAAFTPINVDAQGGCEAPMHSYIGAVLVIGFLFQLLVDKFALARHHSHSSPGVCVRVFVVLAVIAGGSLMGAMSGESACQNFGYRIDP